MTPPSQFTDRSDAESERVESRRPLSRRTTLQSLGVLCTGVGAGCLGGSGPSSDRIRWRKSIRGQPLLDDGTLYVMGRLTLHALSPTDGSRQWVTEYSEDDFDQRLCLHSDIAVDDRRIYVPGCDGLRALRRSDGEQAWFVESPLRQGVGVGDGRVTTERYDIYQDRRRPREEGAEPRVQYRAAHDFEITVTDPDDVGEVIDTAVRNGATEINDVSFTLSTERRRTLERRARSAAMADARSKASALATDANLTVTGVRVIRTGRSGAPRYAGGDGAATATAAASSPRRCSTRVSRSSTTRTSPSTPAPRTSSSSRSSSPTATPRSTARSTVSAAWSPRATPLAFA